jgi:hypothetical protein
MFKAPAQGGEAGGAANENRSPSPAYYDKSFALKFKRFAKFFSGLNQ